MRSHILVILFLLLAAALGSGRPGPARADIYSFVDKEGVLHFSNVPNDQRYRVCLHTRKPIGPTVPAPGHVKSYEPIIQSACRRFGVDTDLVRAVIKAESNFDCLAVSPRGAQGLMQLMPQTAQEMSVFNPFDPIENIHGGVRYLKQLLSRFSGNVSLALAAYNAGPEKVMDKKQIPMIKETQDYVRRVLTYLRSYKGKSDYQENSVL